jgi:hypothetical protein
MNKTVRSLISLGKVMGVIVAGKLAFVSGGGATRDMNMNKTIASLIAIGRVMQLVGKLALVVGVVLSLKNWPVNAVLVGGITAMFVGKRLQCWMF